MNRAVPIVLNVVAFDALWTLCLLGAGKGWWWCGPLGILASGAMQLRFSPSPWKEAMVIVAGSSVGVCFDVVSHLLQLMEYRRGLGVEFVLVFSALWVNFGTTLRTSLAWMWDRPVLGAGLGAVGAPLSYWIGARLGAIELLDPSWRALAWSSAQYGVALPLWMYVARRYLIVPPATGHQPIALATTRSASRPES